MTSRLKRRNPQNLRGRPEVELPRNPRDFKTPNYGLRTFGDLFTPRQLVALDTFSDLIAEARKEIIVAGASQDRADAIATYLAFAVDRAADARSYHRELASDRRGDAQYIRKTSLADGMGFRRSKSFQYCMWKLERCVY